MDPFSPGDQPLSANGNGQPKNGLNRNNLARNGLSNSGFPDRSNDSLETSAIDPLNTLDREAPELIPVLEDQGERFDKARQSAMKVYLVLIVTGVIIGGISLFGIVLVMQHFGLTDVPVPVEQN